MVDADFFVGAFSSNLGRLVYMLRYVVPSPPAPTSAGSCTASASGISPRGKQKAQIVPNPSRAAKGKSLDTAVSVDTMGGLRPKTVR
jgi:hypothetical protein